MIHHRPGCHHANRIGRKNDEPSCRCICTCPDDSKGAQTSTALLAEVYAEFEKFYAASPFVDRGPAIKIAMQGAFLAGYTFLGETLTKHL